MNRLSEESTTALVTRKKNQVAGIVRNAAEGRNLYSYSYRHDELARDGGGTGRPGVVQVADFALLATRDVARQLGAFGVKSSFSHLRMGMWEIDYDSLEQALAGDARILESLPKREEGPIAETFFDATAELREAAAHLFTRFRRKSSTREQDDFRARYDTQGQESNLPVVDNQTGVPRERLSQGERHARYKALKTLGLDPLERYTNDAILAAYRNKLNGWSPDSNNPDAGTQLMKILDARDVLLPGDRRPRGTGHGKS